MLRFSLVFLLFDAGQEPKKKKKRGGSHFFDEASSALRGDVVELDIRNPKATVSNLRAAVAVKLKQDPHSFVLSSDSHPLNNENASLREIGLRDGDFVTVKRSREADVAPSEATAPSSAFVPDENALRQLRDMGFTVEAATEALRSNNNNLSSAADTLLRNAFSAGGSSYVHDTRVESESESDEEGEEGEETAQGAQHEPLDEETARDLEQLVSGLMALPNAANLPERFHTDPQGVLREIQSHNPHLFQLIGRHNQFFLDLVQGGHLGDALQDEGEEAEDSEEAEEVESEEADATAPPAGSAPPDTTQLGPEDEEKITSLMQLGFSREKCQEAYLRAGRSVERLHGVRHQRDWRCDRHPSWAVRLTANTRFVIYGGFQSCQ